MLSAAQGRKQRKELLRAIAREERSKQRAELAGLRQALKDARARLAAARKSAKHLCKTGRREARERAKELRTRVLYELRATIANERQRAKDACETGRATARTLGDKRAAARAKVDAERRYRQDMRRIEAGNRNRRKEWGLAKGRVRRQESDDEVIGNIPPELVALWQRVKGRIRGSDRQSRTEAFLHYAEEHPGEVLESYEDKTEEVIRQLERDERSARKALRRTVPRARIEAAAAAAGGDVPF
jgi:hypothetical protein